MNSRSILVGTCELKRPYQRNLALGFGISGAMHIAVIGAILLAMALLPKPELPRVVSNPEPPIHVEITIPPSIANKPEPPNVNAGRPKANILAAEFIAVPEDEAPVDSDIPTQNELSLLAPDTPPEFLGNGNEVEPSAVLKEILPEPGDFIPYDQFPAVVSSVRPVYPDLARRAGIEGIVWVNVLIDKDGRTRDAIIAKSSGSDVGFEEAAIEAALASVWSPAVANRLPIAIWVTYKVEFKLK